MAILLIFYNITNKLMNFLLFIFYIDWIFLKPSETANICDYSQRRDPLCCPGWIKNVYGDCVKSECDQDCGFGKCVGLNVCECHDKTVRSESCPSTNQKLCVDNCSNKGQCLNGKCICESGYSGENCNITSISTCYVTINRGLCKSTAENLQLTKTECCAIFQVAWGNPCEFCHGDPYCPRGFLRNNGRCEDIDECLFKSICLNGECINERGTFKCRCPPDHKLDQNTMSCQFHRDQCLIYAFHCGLSGKCISTPDGQYKCICKKPFVVTANGKSCVKNSNYNVCKLSGKLCLPYGECQPSGLSYYCTCWPGFFQSDDKKSCLVKDNSDKCSDADIADRCRGGRCISTSKGYRCQCYGDYVSYNNEQECIRYITTPSYKERFCSRWEYYSLCQGGQCIERDNSYYCQCTSGFYSTENGRKCEKKVNENSDICSNADIADRCRGGRCISTSDGYRCQCNGDYVSYNNEQECIRYITTTSNSRRFCSRWEYYSLCQGGQCIERDNSYYCECKSGFYSTENGRKCERNLINYETTVEPDNPYCKAPQYLSRCKGGQCIGDKDYGFKCLCLTGFTASRDGRTCNQETRNIKQKSNYCDNDNNRQRCQTGDCVPDQNYGFKCICKIGYSASEDGRACYKIVNENSDKCSDADIADRCRGGRCISTSKGYRCQCYDDYVSYNNEQECIRYITTPSYKERFCSRWEYYSLCQGGQCIERDNSYYCQCTSGFYSTENGRKCEKKSLNYETTSEPDNSYCKAHFSRCKGGQCIGDKDYGFKCLCLPGFTASRDGRACEQESRNTIQKSNYCDIDNNRQRCQTGDCVPDQYYGFKCICKIGYSASEDGRACYKIEKIVSQCSKYRHQCNGGECIELNNNIFECQCINGLTRSEDKMSCIDNRKEISVCEKYGKRCETGSCYPIGNEDYTCFCAIGYSQTEDKRSCVKRNISSICAKYQYLCNGGECKELDENNYECQCLNGFVTSEDKKLCTYNKKEERIILSLCAQYQHQCNGGGCLDLSENSYECQCLKGFVLSENRKSCIDYRKKESYVSICEQYGDKCATGICYPKGRDDYWCLCFDGYYQTTDKKACLKREVTMPKCDKNRRRCNGGFCFDINNGYLCICNDDYIATEDGRDCIKKEYVALKVQTVTQVAYLKAITINYCMKKEIREKCQPGKCIQAVNDYYCECPQSFKVNPNRHECIRDSSTCPYCFYGCMADIYKCSCPENYENLYNTGLCILKSKSIQHSLGMSTCDSQSGNKTLVIRFNGISYDFTKNPMDLDNSVSKLLLIKEQKSVRINFCVPIRKKINYSMQIPMQFSTDLLSWQVVCIFDC